MTPSSAGTPASSGDSTQGLGRLFVGIVIVEALTIAGLYAFGVYFR